MKEFANFDSDMHQFKTLFLLIFLVTSVVSSDKEPHTNRLANEQSPYLLQHSTNPVDWFPWGEEAFQKAKDEDKPIFLSIGYSTCHWCHVMEHESFEDDSVAKLLNDWFISIKVDREELPEIDHVYMTVCQGMTGSGGWPLTIIMTPEKQPFFAGTYFPKDRRGGKPGLLQLLPIVNDAWTNKRDEIMNSADEVQSFLIKTNTRELGDPPEERVLELAYSDFVNRFDKEEGGFGKSPKFPSPHALLFLMRYAHINNNDIALVMVETTLKNMRLGGIFDHIGFGFHRYSTDQNWLVPHFEKMLYDQAMISIAFSEVYQMTNNEFYARTNREILDYVSRDMMSPDGGFFSAEDADSEGEEGKFYLWSDTEIISTLGEQDGLTFNTIFNVHSGGNYHDEVTGQQTGSNVLHLEKRVKLIAASMDLTPGELHLKINGWREKLFKEREKRILPLKDDKILTDWNGLMIAAFAKAGVALDNPEYTNIAVKAADFILDNVRAEDGRLFKRFRNGSASLNAHLDDYAFMVWGLLELYESTFDPRHLSSALELTTIMVEDFWNEEAGGFFLGSDNAEKLIVRSMTSYDGAIPSGNSVAVNVLNKLARISGNMHWADKAAKTLQTFERDLDRIPSSHAHMLSGYIFDQNAKEVVVVGTDNEETRLFLNTLRNEYEPNRIILYKNGNNLSQVAPWTDTQERIDGKPTAYVCKDFQCNLPTTDLDTALKQLLD